MAFGGRTPVTDFAGHRAAMQAIAPGMHEYDLQAEMECAFRREGSERPAYSSIVGSPAPRDIDEAAIAHRTARTLP